MQSRSNISVIIWNPLAFPFPAPNVAMLKSWQIGLVCPSALGTSQFLMPWHVTTQLLGVACSGHRDQAWVVSLPHWPWVWNKSDTQTWLKRLWKGWLFHFKDSFSTSFGHSFCIAYYLVQSFEFPVRVIWGLIKGLLIGLFIYLKDMVHSWNKN